MAQALLSYDQAPPLAAPLRFFLTAPVFGILAGVLVLYSGADLFASRWTPAALALTHLITAGFMLQVMLGALLQILPVVAGANMARPLRLASFVHLATGVGALCLAAAFFTYLPWLFTLAAALLGVGIVVFVFSAGRALWDVASIGPTITGLKLSLVGLTVTVALGVLLSLALAGSLDLPVLQLAEIHLGWGLVAWGTILLAGIATVVVPMFQITPAYPVWFGRVFLHSALLAVLLWSVADLVGYPVLAEALAIAVLAVPVLFCGVTLAVQRRSKRPRFDATQHYWRVALISALVACAVWFAGRYGAVDDTAWPLLCGVLVLSGGFMSVMIGMLYKIVPFLVWLHLQNQGQGRLMAPNMKKMIGEAAMTRQMLAHFASCALLVLAVFWPGWLAYPAGLALIAANGGLLHNLLGALRVYRNHQRKIGITRQAV